MNTDSANAHDGGIWDEWVKHPQRIWLRRAIFQIHLWTGLTIGLYVVLMSLSGTILVYHNEIASRSSRPATVTGSGPRMTLDQLREAARRAYPGYEVLRLLETNPDRPVEVFLSRGATRIQRLFNPYTGADMGDALLARFRFIEWLDDLHGNLLQGRAGRLANVFGGFLVAFLGLTGALIWWPGIDEWRRSLRVDTKANFRRFNWTLHSVLGFWFFAFVIMWGISGVYLSAPNAFHAAVDFVTPINPNRRGPRLGDQLLLWLSQAHFGRFAGLPTEIVWSIVGLAPTVLFITGTLMWWNRVLRPWLLSHEPAHGEKIRGAKVSGVHQI